jgi:hypothetical protein
MAILRPHGPAPTTSTFFPASKFCDLLKSCHKSDQDYDTGYSFAVKRCIAGAFLQSAVKGKDKRFLFKV